MEGRTFVRIFVLVACVAVTGLGWQNANGDNTDAIAIATSAACKDDEENCSASLTQQSRGSFDHEYSFKTVLSRSGKKSEQQVIVACQRELVLIGAWKCAPK
jgi:hypothetical protein